MNASNSHANYEGTNGTPLQARIEATVTRGLGYSDRFDSIKAILYKPDTHFLYKVGVGDDDPKNLETSLLSLDVRSGANITYLTLNDLVRRQEPFFTKGHFPSKNKGLFDRIGDKLRLLLARTEMSFASISETRPYFEGSAFTEDKTPRDEGLKLPRYPTADDETCHIPGTQRVDGINYLDTNCNELDTNCNELPPQRGELEFVFGEKNILFIDSNPDAALQRMIGRAEFEEPQTCDWKPQSDADSNVTHLPDSFVEPQNSSPLLEQERDAILQLYDNYVNPPTMQLPPFKGRK